MYRAARVALLSFLLLLGPALAIPARTEAVPSGDDVVLADDVVFIEVLPYPRSGLETEFFTIHNPTDNEIDLTDWAVCDQNTCLRTRDGTSIGAKGTLTFAENSELYKAMTGRDPFLWPQPIDEKVFEWPTMANDGDFLWLEDDHGTVIDVVVFGRAYQGDGWSGLPGPAPVKGWMMVRDHRLDGHDRAFVDSDSSDDWPWQRARRAEHVWMPLDGWTDTEMRAAPLRFPDDGEVLAGVMTEARTELLINIYEFTSRSMAEVVASVAENGTEVKVLLERSPVGGIHDTERYVIGMLTEAGCDVRLVGSNISAGMPGRFRYDHAKYMVIDGGVTVVMSENLVPSALNTSSSGSGNRGWGVVVWNEDLADHFKAVFEHDWGSGLSKIEVVPEGYLPSQEGGLVPSDPGSLENRSLDGNGSLVPMVSPDGAEDLMLSMIGETNDRLYIEMLSCSMEWGHLSNVEPSPVLDAVMEAARRGVEVKILLDDNFLSTSDNDEVVAYVNEVATSEGLDLEARLAEVQDISMVHNKGIIADDKVLVSSINWVDTAFRDNREVGLLIELKGLADIYSSFFLLDWVPISNDMDRPVPPTPDQDIKSIYPVCGSLLLIGAIVILALGVGTSKDE